MTAGRIIAASLLTLALFWGMLFTFTVEELNDKLLNADFLLGQFERLGVYDFLADDVYPAAVEEILADPDPVLPDTLQGLELPQDEAAQAALVRLMRAVIPPSYVEAQTVHSMGQIVAYARNESDAITIVPAFDERLRAVATAPPGERSELEVAFRALGLGRRVVDRLIDDAIVDLRATDPGAAAALRLSDRDDAAAWFTESVFDSVDSIVPFLVGETETFEIRVSFEGREPLAFAFAELLERPREELLAEGYVVTEAELEERIGVSIDSVVDDPRNHLEALQTGFRLTLDDLYGTDRAGLERRDDVDEARAWLGRFTGILRWALFAGMAAMALLIGFVGGAGWSTRLLWGAGSLFACATLIAILAGPVYDGVAADEIRAALRRDSSDWPASLFDNRTEIIDDTESIFDAASGGFVGEAAMVMIPTGILLAVAALWMWQERRPTSQAGLEGGTPSQTPPVRPL